MKKTNYLINKIFIGHSVRSKTHFSLIIPGEVFMAVTTKTTPLECDFMHVGISVPGNVLERL
jgi:hypothetical protein